MVARTILLYLFAAASADVTAFVAFTPANSHPRRDARRFRDAHASSCRAASAGGARTETTTYKTTLVSEDEGNGATSRWQRMRRILRNRNTPDDEAGKPVFQFTSNCDELVIGSATNPSTTAVLLVHPIGVGIGRWYYNRLLASLAERYGDIGHRLAFLAPDLLGSATASGPVGAAGEIPLLNVTDWTYQLTHLMAAYETKSEMEGHPIDCWTVVANGGCAPIALKVASESLQQSPPFQAALTNVIISSPPRLPFFLESADPAKVRKSYRTLSGVAGRLFWWYALRKEGRFIQKFSERNLVGDAANLGKKWTPNCLEAAAMHGGRSRYSTFAFLAGTLQDGCLDSLNALKGTDVKIDFIRGTDKRRNRAKSWFWTRKRKGASAKEPPEETIRQYVNKQGNRGSELFIGGRISLAWEDATGYAKALMELLCE